MQILYLLPLLSLYLISFSKWGKLAINTTLGKVSRVGTSQKNIFSTRTTNKLNSKFFFSDWIQAITIYFLTIGCTILWFQKYFKVQHIAFLAASWFLDWKNIFVGSLFKPSFLIETTLLVLEICRQKNKSSLHYF